MILKYSSLSTDAQLVRRVQKGDKGAFDLLVLKYQYKITKLITRYIRDPDQALDITQETFLKAYRAQPGFVATARSIRGSTGSLLIQPRTI